jgi:hypothetical protein
MVDDLVDCEIEDGEVGEEPGIKHALFFVDDKYWFNFVFPVILHAFFVLHLAGGSGHAFHGQHGGAEVRPAANAVDAGLILEVSSE